MSEISKNERTGLLVPRDKRKRHKVPELGYYLVVTDTEATERYFFLGLHSSLADEIKNKLVIKVVETKTRYLIDKCIELTAYDSQYRIPWIVFDRDQVRDFDEIIYEAEKKNINVGWSNPCFEIWLYSYFERCLPLLIHGIAVKNLEESLKTKHSKSIVRRMIKYTTSLLSMVTKKLL